MNILEILSFNKFKIKNIDKYISDIDVKFKKDQWVFIFHYHTWNIKKPTCAKIIGLSNIKGETHSYVSEDCNWYWIICDGNRYPSLFPENGLIDIKEYIHNELENLELVHKMGSDGKGYNYNAFKKFSDNIKMCLKKV
jgi:hypothetical protein